jgi:hypothetical protein
MLCIMKVCCLVFEVKHEDRKMDMISIVFVYIMQRINRNDIVLCHVLNTLVEGICLFLLVIFKH